MSNGKSDHIHSAFVKGCCIVWASWVIIEYLAHHSYLTQAIVQMPYWRLLLALLVLIALETTYFYKFKPATATQKYSFTIRGIGIFLIFQALSLFILAAFTVKSGLADLSWSLRLGYFMVFSNLQLAAVLLVVLWAYALGQVLLKRLSADYSSSFYVLAIGLGFSILGVGLTILGLLQALKPLLIWSLLAGVLIWQYKACLAFLHLLWIKPYRLVLARWWTLPLISLLLIVVAINWIGAIKPFPIGYDGTTIYLNTAQLISDYQALPAGGQAFNWSVVMSLGSLLFKSVTVSILLSHLMGILCLVALFQLGRIWLQPSYALMAALCAYIAPYFSFHSVIDEKVDLAFLFIALCSLLLIIVPWVQPREGRGEATARWLMAGWLCGFAFGIKYTALFLVIALLGMLWYKSGRRQALGAYFLLSIGVLFLLRIHQFGHIDIESSVANTIGWTLGGSGLGWLLLSYRNDLTQLKKIGVLIAGFLGMFVLAYSPWATKHLSENQAFSLQSIIQGRPGTPAIDIPPQYLSAPPTGHRNTRPRPKTKTLAKETPPAPLLTTSQEPPPAEGEQLSARKQTIREEVGRYLGYEARLWQYLSLPYDLTMNTNVTMRRYQDIGFLFLLLLPLLLLAGEHRRRTLRNLGLGLLLLLGLGLSYHSVYAPAGLSLHWADVVDNRASFFVAHPGGAESFFFEAYMALLRPLIGWSQQLEGLYRWGEGLSFIPLLALLLLLIGLVYALAAHRLRQLPEGLKILLAFLLLYGFNWWIFGNGIVWYAFPFWAILPIVLLYFFQRPEQLLGKANRSFVNRFFGVVFGLYLAFNGALYFTNPYSSAPIQALFKWQFVEYASNPAYNKDQTIARYNPTFPEVIRTLNADQSEK
ncbi:MAG: glycosyltransferase family 39 protein, partial [Bacteroidota bacterium]